MKLKTIKTIAKKEFWSYLNSPLAYTIAIPFILITTFIYLRSALSTGDATLRPYFELLPWFLVVLAPAISMKLLSDEQKDGTLEVMFAHPVSEVSVVLGKFLGALSFFALLLLLTIGLPITLFIFSKPDTGQLIGQYLGALLIGAVFISASLAASAYSKNTIGSFLLAAAISFVLIFIGLDFVTLLLPTPFNIVASQMAVTSHVDNLSKGLLDLRDIAYYLSASALFLTAAVLKLSERKVSEDRGAKQSLTIALIVIIGIGIFSNVLLANYPLRLDITRNRLFTLSQGTKQTLEKLPDITTLTLIASSNLPAETATTGRSVLDILKDYQKESSNVRVRVLDPGSGSEAMQEAQSAGVQEVTFNKVASGRFEAQSGYLGLQIRYGDKTETIPFISQTSDLEYQITRRIRKLASDQEQIVGVIGGNAVTPGTPGENQAVRELISTQYKVEDIDTTKKEGFEKYVGIVVIDNGTASVDDANYLKEFLEKGGSALVFSGGVSINTRAVSATETESKIIDLTKDFGITINKDLVYDLQANEILSFTQGGNPYVSQYPYWIRAIPTRADAPGISGQQTITLLWPSSLSLEEKDGFETGEILTTTNAGDSMKETFSISPESIEDLKSSNPRKVPVVAYAKKEDTKLAVVASSQVANDQFLTNNPDAVSFIAGLVDYVSADAELSAIPNRSSSRAAFLFNRPQDILFVQIGNTLVPAFLVFLFSIYWLRRRKKLQNRVYESK